MAFLIWAAGRQARFDGWVAARDAGLGLWTSAPADRAPWPWAGVPLAAGAVGVLGIWVGRRLGPSLTEALAAVAPSVAAGFKTTTWTVLTVTTAGLGLAFSGRFRARPERTEFLGNALLYFLLTTLGAQASLGALGRAPAYLVMGAGALAVHAVFLMVGARMFRLAAGPRGHRQPSLRGRCGVGAHGGGRVPAHAGGRGVAARGGGQRRGNLFGFGDGATLSFFGGRS
jgi:hypothetical protein